MRKGLVVVLVLLVALAVSSCSDVHDETIISDISLYDTIWNLPEIPQRRASETSDLFPSAVEENTVIHFYYRHITYTAIGTGWEVELAVQYTDELFLDELKRLSDLCKDSIVCGESKYFDTLCYASVWNWNGCFEYAVVNEKEKTIGYLYLQLINKNNLKISSCYIPHEYEMQFSDSEMYIIY